LKAAKANARVEKSWRRRLDDLVLGDEFQPMPARAFVIGLSRFPLVVPKLSAPALVRANFSCHSLHLPYFHPA